jgi:nucleoid-associated protein YgaU
MTTSRYVGQTTVSVPQDDGTTRPLLAPRVAPELPEAVRYLVREGDRLDLLAGTALGDSTGWWRIADANPQSDPLATTETGTTIGVPGA